MSRTQQPVTEPQMAPEGRRPAAIRVLLIEDHEMVAQSLRRILDSVEDIEVVDIAVTAAAGIAAATHLRPDVVLMDHGLPDGDGVVAAGQILRELPACKVVMLTGSADDDRLAVRALDAGCAGFVGKREPIDMLVTAIRAAFAGDAVIAPSMLVRLLPRITGRAAPSPTSLSDRELEVLHIMAEGGTDKEIARKLVISLNTTRKHVQTIIRKLGAHSKLEAVVVAVRDGIIQRL
jgi:DNA-binding NarL/FixJ family response regulator